MRTPLFILLSYYERNKIINACSYRIYIEWVFSLWEQAPIFVILRFQVINKNDNTPVPVLYYRVKWIHLPPFSYSTIGDAHRLSRASTVFNYKNTVSILYISSTVTTIDILLQHPTTIANVGFRKLSAVSKTDEVSRVRMNIWVNDIFERTLDPTKYPWMQSYLFSFQAL